MVRRCVDQPRWVVLLLVLVLTSALGLPAQVQDDGTDGFEPKENALGLGAFLYSNGIGFNVRRMHRLENQRELTFEISIASLKDHREVRTESEFSDRGGKDYIYDKKNYAYALTFTAGYGKVIFPATEFNQLSIHVGVEGGPVLGLLKPYYIEYYQNNPPGGNQVAVEQFDADRHDRRLIVGEADFFTGLGQLQLVPGLRLEAYTTVNLAGSNLFLRALHLGLQTDIFTQKLPIMDARSDKALFLGGSLGFIIGNAW
jgi:hypothetical protein